MSDGVLVRGRADHKTVRALQRSLRAIGYQKSGVTGEWSEATAAAVRALRHDLLHNHGLDSADATVRAPVSIASFNVQGAVTADPPTGASNVEPALAACLAALLADPRIGTVPDAADPAAANAQVAATVTAIRSDVAPTPFLRAIFRQESAGQHYHVTRPGDEDRFVIVGLDRNDKTHPEAVTSRGYGVGQFTLFHHPPSVAEIADVVMDPLRNVSAAYAKLRTKFRTSVVSKDPEMRADERLAEHPILPLRPCKYALGNTRRYADCAACAAAARKVDITPGTPVHKGASLMWAPTQYYPSARYHGVPDRADFACDWPYAVRRYNGGGINSYHYQARVLTNLLA